MSYLSQRTTGGYWSSWRLLTGLTSLPKGPNHLPRSGMVEQPDTQSKRRHLMKLSKLLLMNVFALSAIGFTAVAAHAEDLLDSVKHAGVLRIGLEGTYPPFDSRNSAGELEGFDVDVAKAVAAKLGVKPQFIPTEWSGIIAA